MPLVQPPPGDVPAASVSKRHSGIFAIAERMIGGLPKTFWALWSGTLVNRIGCLVQPFLAYYLTGTRGLSVTMTGAVLATCGAGSVVSQIIAGLLADRIGRRGTLTFGMVANASALVGLGYARALVPLVIAALLFGATVDVYRPASSALVADLVPPVERPRAYGMLFWAVNLGFSAAMVLGGVLARADFLWLFWADAGTCVLFGVIVWRAVPADGPRRWSPARARGRLAPGLLVADSAAGNHGGKLRDVARDGVMAAYLALSLCYCLVYLQAYTTLPLAIRLRGLPPQAYGLAMAVNGVLIVALQPVVSAWLRQHNRTIVLAAGFTIVGLGFGLTATATSVTSYAATVAVWTLGEIVTAGIGAAIVADLAPAHMRGRYNGAYGAAWSVAYLLAPLVGTRLLSISPQLLWVSCSAMSTVAAVALLALGPRLRHRAQPAKVAA